MKESLTKIPFSVTLKYTQLVQSLQNEGKDIVRLTAGEPDFNTPDQVKKAAVQALNDNFTKYTSAAGIRELREAVADMLGRQYNLDYKGTQIVVTNGGKQALYEALYAVTDEEDEVLVFTPDWVSYIPQIKMCKAVPVVVPALAENGFEPYEEDIREKITEKTRAVIVNSPNNPTGAVYSEDTLRGILKVAMENDLWIISDEIYANLVYDGAHRSIGSLDPTYKKVITINGFSKSHAMTGWRCGYCAAPIEVSKEIVKMQSHLSSNVNSITQMAALEALAVNTDYMRERFRERREIVTNGLQEIGIPFFFPKGAFYCFIDFSWLNEGGGAETGRVYKDDDELAMELIKEYGLALIPGSAFHAPWFMRLSYASSEKELEKALAILKRFKDEN